MRSRLAVTIASLALSLSGCIDHHSVTASPATAPTLTGDPAHPGVTSGWVDTRLYFSLGPIDQPSVSEARFRDFLDREVTTRFPDGFSVLDVYGQWKSKTETTPEREHTKMLMVDYPDTQENRAKIDAIRAAWKKIKNDLSVLRVTQPADVSF
jgi:hypothetical protein